MPEVNNDIIFFYKWTYNDLSCFRENDDFTSAQDGFLYDTNTWSQRYSVADSYFHITAHQFPPPACRDAIFTTAAI
jgi:hypothetical protein